MKPPGVGFLEHWGRVLVTQVCGGSFRELEAAAFLAHNSPAAATAMFTINSRSTGHMFLLAAVQIEHQ